MFKSLKGLFSSKNKDLRKRIYITLAILAIFGLGTNIVVPHAKSITQNLDFLDLLNLMSGGNFFNICVRCYAIYFGNNPYTIITNGYYSIF